MDLKIQGRGGKGHKFEQLSNMKSMTTITGGGGEYTRRTERMYGKKRTPDRESEHDFGVDLDNPNVSVPKIISNF